jgi:hypothetical protein
VKREIERRPSMHTQARDRHGPSNQEGATTHEELLKEREPEPLEAPSQDPADPDLIPEEDDDFALPGEDDEYAAPVVDPHEEPLVTP